MKNILRISLIAAMMMVMSALIVYSAEPQERVATPTASPSGGTFTESQTVTLHCETEGAEIFFSINSPDVSYPIFPFMYRYTEPITLTSTTTIFAYAEKDGVISNFLRVTFTKTPKDLNEFEEEYNISYYMGGIKDASNLSSVKIGTTQELAERWKGHVNITEKYNDDFFNNRILVLVNWVERHSNRTHQVSSVLIEGGMINIGLSPVDYLREVEGYTALTPWCAVLEMDRELADM